MLGCAVICNNGTPCGVLRNSAATSLIMNPESQYNPRRPVQMCRTYQRVSLLKPDVELIVVEQMCCSETVSLDTYARSYSRAMMRYYIALPTMPSQRRHDASLPRQLSEWMGGPHLRPPAVAGVVWLSARAAGAAAQHSPLIVGARRPN
jgi:hypothetical protein